MKSWGGLVMVALVASNIQAGCHNHNGGLVCSQTELKNIHLQGYVSLMNVAVGGETIIEGMLQAKKSKFSGNIKVKGSIHMKGSRVLGKTFIMGALDVENSRLKDIEITAKQAVFSQSQAGTVRVKRTPNDTQRIYLQGGTLISGNIVFESGNGEVVKSDQARVLGQIIGGHVVK
ncbi:MAG TPA: hypothetical protein QF353_03855 [Gammaproteobacteria bacterium]|nr:hypothetical protein [Gammaproteobacteria bacterium]